MQGVKERSQEDSQRVAEKETPGDTPDAKEDKLSESVLVKVIEKFPKPSFSNFLKEKLS